MQMLAVYLHLSAHPYPRSFIFYHIANTENNPFRYHRYRILEKNTLTTHTCISDNVIATDKMHGTVTVMRMYCYFAFMRTREPYLSKPFGLP